MDISAVQMDQTANGTEPCHDNTIANNGTADSDSPGT
jgi:hypothetical protein